MTARTRKTKSLFDRFIDFDDRLASRGVPPLGAWWREGLRRWFAAYERSDALELYACVGRGAAKSTVIYKLALFFTAFGDFNIPIGERHYAIVLSRLKEEAAKGIAIISQWMRLIGIAHKLAGDVIELADSPRGIRVAAASVAGASGWRAFFIGRDERSKWGVSGIEEHDAEEIDASATAMTTTHARAPIVTMGSAWGQFGSFYDSIMAGDVDGRIVLGPQPTWVASDNRITEQECRRKEHDDRRFEREYLCVFQGAASQAFDLAALRDCIVDGDFVPGPHAPIVVQDPSGGSENAFAVCTFQWGHSRFRPLQPILRMSHLYAIDDAKKKGITADAMANMVRATAHASGADTVHSDQHAAWSWRSAYEARELKFREWPWTNPTKHDAAVRLRELIETRTLSIEPGPEADALIIEAGFYEERLTPSGNITFGGARGNDDRVSLLMLIARIDTELRVIGSPLRATRQSRIIDLHQKHVPAKIREVSERIERAAAFGLPLQTREALAEAFPAPQPSDKTYGAQTKGRGFRGVY